MKLVSFSVQNFRSITTTHKLRIKDSTILIGPNNEGKSNILKALVTALECIYVIGIKGVIRRGGMVRTKGRGRLKMEMDYDWERDFPISLQDDKPNDTSVFSLEFELTEDEKVEFRREVKSSLTGTLPIQISIGSDEEPDFKVKVRGPGAKALSKKADTITFFIANRLDFQYIPAIRTAQEAQDIVEGMVARELSVIEKDQEYIEALNIIEKLQAPILERLSYNIRDTLVEFLPAITDVNVKVSQERRFRALRQSCEIVVDDGTPTLLKYKGDGVKSLAALSLMRHVSERGARGRHLILAIEEPESHLHPSGIHQLKRVLNEMSEKHQIILTSHNPLFVDRHDISSNIIVTANKAVKAGSISQIRAILGVHVSDNLRDSELVLFVEGEDDRTALNALLNNNSQKLREALRSGKIAIDSLLGGSNLAYKLSEGRKLLCRHHSFLDHDKCGLDAAEKAEKEGLLSPADVNYSVCEGMKEAEIEDMYEPSLYREMIYRKYNANIDSPRFKNNRKKWSDRLRDVFIQQGKHWDKKVERKWKNEIAELVSSEPSASLNRQKRSAFDALVKALEAKL